MAKRSLCLLLALATLFSLAAPAFAEEAPAEEPIVTEEPLVEAEVPVEMTEDPVAEAEEPAEEPEEVPEAEAPADEPMPVEAAEEPVEVPEITEAPEPAEEPEATVEGEPATVATTSGTCGKNLKWSLSGGTLTISGTGAMYDYEWGDAPWYNLIDQIKSVVIQNGVTSIARFAFSDCLNLVSVTFPSSVTSVGKDAFWKTPWLKAHDYFVVVNGVLFEWYNGDEIKGPKITIPDGVTRIADYACEGGEYVPNTLAGVTFPDSLVEIGAGAFGMHQLTSVTLPASVAYVGDKAFAITNLTSVTILNPNCKIIETSEPYYGFGSASTLSGATIRGYDGSTAETFAKEHGYDFESLGPAPTAAPKPTATPAPAKLATPKITKMENTASGLKVTWSKVKGADRYTVFYKLKGAAKWTKIGTTTATSYTRKAKDLKSGKTYVFTIRCVKNDKKTYTSDYDKAGKSLTYYAAPTVKISKASNGGIKVTWNKVAGASRYMVYYKENGGSWKRIGTTTSTSYTRAASKLKNGATYQFTVRCVKNDKKTMLSGYKASNSLKYKK